MASRLGGAGCCARRSPPASIAVPSNNDIKTALRMRLLPIGCRAEHRRHAGAQLMVAPARDVITPVSGRLFSFGGKNRYLASAPSQKRPPGRSHGTDTFGLPSRRAYRTASPLHLASEDPH